MKKIMNLFALLLVFVVCLFTFGCEKEEPSGDVNDPVVTIEYIEVVTTSVPATILTTELDDKIDDIQIQIKKSDNSVETINLSKSMISQDDLAKLATEGFHTITITYEGKTTTIKLLMVEPSGPVVGEKDPIPYSIYIEDIAGKPLSGFYVWFYLDDEVVADGYTGSDGLFVTELEPNNYDVIVEGREGYYLNQENFTTDLLGTQINVPCELDSLEGIEAEVGHGYEVGDLIYDFTLTDTDDNELKLYELLKTKKVVFLNFWYTTCSACLYEFPYMVEAYESSFEKDGITINYSDEIAIIAINPGIAGNQDTLQDVINFKVSMGLSFNVAMDYDYNPSNLTMDPALTSMFGVNAYPTTVIVDRYGLIAEIEPGAVTSTEKWTQAFDKYISDDYVPEYKGSQGDDDGEYGYVLPPEDAVYPSSEELSEAINGKNHDGTDFECTYRPDEDDEYSWPWVVEEYDGKVTMRPSNKHQHPSYATLFIDVHLKAGEAFTFDYYCSTEEYDILYIVVNNTIATQISGQSPAWEKSYAYVAIEEDDYEIGLCYIKDGSYSMGQDSIYISNVRIELADSIDKETYIFREAATGNINEITMRYENYVNAVYNEEDGYYHVNDVNGPLLLADMLSGTKWNNSTLYDISLEGKCIGDDGVDYNELIEEYTIYASNSSVGYTPITKELADALKQIVKALGDDAARNNLDQWLEVCVYYSAYGTNGVELGLPTIGVCPFEPIMFDGNAIDEPATAEGLFDRIILPRGIIFGFVPEQSGVYAFYSTEEQLETVGWVCDKEGDAIRETDNELRLFAQQSSNGETVDHNFIAYIYLEQGELYLFRAAFYDIYEYSTITVEMKYISEKMELLTLGSPGFFTSSDDEMSDIISGNYIDVELGQDGFYHVANSLSSDDFVYCDMTYINGITGYSLIDCLNRFDAFNFGKDEFGNVTYDEEGYYRISGYNDAEELVQFYVCRDAEGNEYYVETIGEDGKTEENGYTYVKFTAEELESMKNANFTEYVKTYVTENMITDESSELYGCVKVDEKFAVVLGLLMDKYTFQDVDYSWVKLCYYFKYLGPIEA